MTTPYPLPRSTRETEWLKGDGRSTYGAFDFKIFDLEDVQVRLREVGDDGFEIANVTVAKTTGAPFDTFTVTFPFPVEADREYQVRGLRLHERTSDLFRGGSINSLEVERETSKGGVVLQEVRRDVSDGIGLWAVERAARIAGDLQNQLAINAEAETRQAEDTAIRQQIGVIIPTVTLLTERAEHAAETSENAADAAQSLVEAATSGFQGFVDGMGYDFGFITQPMTYFNRDFGSITDPVIN